MTLRDDLLDVVDSIRGIPDELGLRLYTVSIRVRTWNGSRPGVDASTATDADTYFYVDAGTHRPHVRQLTERELLASGGAYNDQDLKIGPITPPYTGGGVDITVFDPVPGSFPTEVFFLVSGPGMAAGGSWYKKIAQDVTGPFSYTFTVRRTGETLP